MLPTDPNWLNADSALWVAIFAGLSFLATCGGIVVAVFALRWARTAALEASKQANAAIESIEWSRKAAQAAQNQIGVLERQLQLSEPQPVVVLRIAYQGEPVEPMLLVENVGEDLAFEVDVIDQTPLLIGDVTEVRPRLTFFPEAVLGPSQAKTLTWIEGAKRSGPLGNPAYIVGNKLLFTVLFAEVMTRADIVKGDDARLPVRKLKATYKNARRRTFESEFVLGMRDMTFECWTETPLVERIAAAFE